VRGDEVGVAAREGGADPSGAEIAGSAVGEVDGYVVAAPRNF